MSLAKDLKVKVSVDGLCLTSTNLVNDIMVGKKLGRYKAIEHHNIHRQRGKGYKDAGREDNFERCHNYAWRHIFRHVSYENQLTVCNIRISKEHLIPAIRLEFLSSLEFPLARADVEKVIQDLEVKRNLNFGISHLDLAIDLVHPTKINLHKRVNRSINPKKKRVVEETGTGTSFGSARSSNRLTSYDKAKQLREDKRIEVKGDISRVEIRLHPPRMDNFIRTLDDLMVRGWGLPLYGRYFSLDSPSNYARALWGKGVMKIAIRNLKGELEKQLEEVPLNFHRDYLQEHKLFGPMVRKALARFRWK